MIRDYAALGKVRIALMVAITTFLGYWFAQGRDGALLFWTLSGTVLSSCAAGALNQLLEIEPDGIMRRTRNRPLPAGRLSPLQAARFAGACAAAGLFILFARVNVLAGALTLFTIVSYAFVYTPLKRLSPQSTWVGSLSGAIPPLIGWAAARGRLDAGAWALFAIQFIWQIPHFLAMFWIHREDYARAGFKVMPVVDPGGSTTACQIALHSFALLLASVMPTLFGLSGARYGYGALILGSAFLAVGLKASWTMEVADARLLFRASLAYLPAIFTMLAWT